MLQHLAVFVWIMMRYYVRRLKVASISEECIVHIDSIS